MSSLPRTALCRSLAVLFTAFLATNAFAFKAKIHEQFTNSVLKTKGFSDKSASAVGDADYYTDIKEPTNSSAHCDNEDLDGCSGRINAQLQSVIDKLAACDKKEALKEMGRGLHTLQDFYSHSNWINHNGGSYPGIYSMGHPPASLSCSPPTFAPGGLTSGYFSLSGFFDPNPFITQCRTTPSNKCCHKDLNKDDDSREPLFTPAKGAAETSTGEFEDRLESMIRSKFAATKADGMIKLLKKDQRNIAFCIDDTGSMSQDLAGVKSTVSSLAQQISAGDESPKFSLYTFKDDVTFRGETCDLTDFQAKVAPLFADGGGDCPEASNAAQLEAAGALDDGGDIFLATDASARDPEIGPTLESVVQTKNININVILTGNCVSDPGTLLGPVGPSATELTPESDAVISPADLTSPSSVRIFAAEAALSGGMFFRVNRTEFTQAANVLLIRTRPDNADILYAVDSTTSGKSYSVPVDSTLADVTFVANRLSTASTFTLAVTRPNGSLVAAGDPDATFTTISGVSAITIKGPATGNWTMAVGGSGRFVASAFGKSGLNLLRLRFFTPAQVSPHLDEVPITGMPIGGESFDTEARMTPGYANVNFALRNLDSTVLLPLSLAADGPNVFSGTTAVPSTDFLAYATGTDANGNPFQRVFRKIMKGQSVRVTPKVYSATAAAGSTISYDFDITNLTSSAATFRLFFDSTHRFPVFGPFFIGLASGETKTVTLQVAIPSIVTGTDDDLLSLVATSTSDPGVSNSAVVTTIIGVANQPPNCSAAQATISTIWPANGKFVDVGITGVTDPDGDPVTIAITAITQDEATDDLGDGATCPDAIGLGTSTASLRAERSGLGDGRVYTINFTASDGKGGSCGGSVTVCVPHDQGNQPCADSGQLFDATSCRR
jgi:hypothetical protein